MFWQNAPAIMLQNIESQGTCTLMHQEDIQEYSWQCCSQWPQTRNKDRRLCKPGDKENREIMALDPDGFFSSGSSL